MAFVLEIIVLVFLIILSGFFVLSEIAVISSRKARLQHLANKGNARAKATLEFTKSPGPFLSTVQVGITLVGILAGAFGEYALAEHIAQYIQELFPLGNSAHAIALTLVVIIITYLSVVVGELLPKEFARFGGRSRAGPEPSSSKWMWRVAAQLGISATGRFAA